MKKLSVLFFYLLTFIVCSSFSKGHAELYTVYFADSKTKNFSVAGYDIDYKTGDDAEGFLAPLGKKLAVYEQGTETLLGSGYRKIIRIEDPETGLSRIFLTRVINENNALKVIKMDPPRRRVDVVGECVDPETGGWERKFQLTIKVGLHLEDGYLLTLNYIKQKPYSEYVKPEAEFNGVEFPYNEIDEVVFEEMKFGYTLDFQKRLFSVKILNKGQVLNQHLIAEGFLRQPNPQYVHDDKTFHICFIYPIRLLTPVDITVMFDDLFGHYELIQGDREEFVKLSPRISKFNTLPVELIEHFPNPENPKTYLYVFKNPKTGNEFILSPKNYN